MDYKPKENGDQELLQAIYGVRLLVFIETNPQTNKYHQVLLNPEEFKRVSFAFGTKRVAGKAGLLRTKIETGNVEYNLPDLQEIHEKNEHK